MAIAGIPSPGVCAYPTGSASRRSARRRVDGVGIEIGDAAQGSVLDVGEGGLRVKAADPSAFDAGTLVCFPLPEGAVIKANCEVVWANAEGVAGLRFLAFSDNSKAKLSAWLAGRASEAAARPEPVAAAVAAVAAEEPRATAIPAAEASWSTEADEPGLSKLIRSMMLMTAADGAAIALRVGDGIVCRARAGNAPQLGVKLNPDAGLSGRCLRDGEPVLCRDSESDPAVNAEACRALRLRAALLVPVKHEGQVEGVLEVFSSKPDVFDIGDIAALQRLSEKIVEYLPRPQPAIEVSAPEAEALVPTEAVPAETSSVAPEATIKEAVGEPQPEIARPSLSASPNTFLRLIDDPHYRTWKRATYWAAIAVRSGLSLLTLTVPLSYLGYFLIGPVIRPAAMQNTAVFRYMSAVVQPGMERAEYFFSFRAVINGWNLMFLVVAVLTLFARGLALRPVNFVLRQVEIRTRPRKRYAYVPYLPHKTEFR